MKLSGLSRTRFALVALMLGLTPAAAMAYIDPGSGAYMVQVLFTLAAAAFFYVRHPIRSLRALWNWMTNRWKQEARPSQTAVAASSSRTSEEHRGDDLLARTISDD
jgi:hypothetical protein